jgi:hypothetical protein
MYISFMVNIFDCVYGFCCWGHIYNITLLIIEV